MSGQARGISFAIMAFLIWGFCPLYFKLLTEVPASEILANLRDRAEDARTEAAAAKIHWAMSARLPKSR